jgi:hypothetical protein
MKVFFAVVVLAISGVAAIGCAASTGDGTTSAPDPKACEAQTSADGVTAIPAGCEAEPAAPPAPPAPAAAAVVGKVGVLVVANDLGPDNVQ